MKIISVANQKGGVAKTTTVLNVGAALQLAGKKVLLIDLDPQASLTYSIGLQGHELPYTVYDLIREKADVKDTIQDVNGLHIIPSSLDLAGADIEISGIMGREYLLRKALTKAGKYDIVLIDCPPSLSLLTLNAFTASQAVYIPVQADFLSIQSIKLLTETINRIKEFSNPGLYIGGAIITRYSARLNISKKALDYLQDTFKETLFKTFIRENVTLKEAPGLNQNIFEYDPASNGAEDYKALGKEIIKRERL